MSRFDLLTPELVRLLADEGFQEPSDIQELTIPHVLNGENILIVAPTGVGKTESAVLPVFNTMIREAGRPISFIYITPLRALNRDMLRRFLEWGEKLGIRVAVRHGDTTKSERAKQSRDPPDMLITTPETLQVMLTGSRLREALSNVRSVVVDEIHELASDERGAQMSIALQRLERYAGRFQRIGISATISNPVEVASFLGGPRPVKVVKAPMPKAMDLSISLVRPGAEDRKMAGKLTCAPELAGAIRQILHHVDNSESTLVFVNTREAAESIASRIRILGREDIGVHHGSLSREVRETAEDAFKSGELKALISTSSLELGIDIGRIDTVIQYNSPRQVSRLVQRIGRSGHGLGRTSKGIILCTSSDEAMESASIARLAGMDMIEPVEIRENPLSVLANQLAAVTLEHSWEIDDLYCMMKEAYPFRNLERESFGRVLSTLESTGLVGVREGMMYGRRAREYFYENISMIPDSRTYRIKDSASRRYIGILDEAFVISHLDVGASFIIKGTSWRVEELGDEILVSRISDVAPLPSWVGEEIPVPYEVAQDVGGSRKKMAKKARSRPEEKVPKDI